MYLAHYLIPVAIYFFIKKDKIILFGLMLGNAVDLDHILLRIIGVVPWLGNICNTPIFWHCNGFLGYPSHTLYVAISLAMLSIILFFLMQRQKELKINRWIFWICNGALLNLLLDFVQLSTGVGFAVSN